MKIIKNLLEKCSDIMFPKMCIYCGKPVKDAKSFLCPMCKDLLISESAEGCLSCGKPFAHCRCKPTMLQGETLISSMPYKSENSVLRQMILLSKKRKNAYVLDDIAQRMASAIRENGNFEGWAITYVPRAPKAVNYIGHDQAKELAKRISKALNLPLVKTLYCKETNLEQKTLDIANRRVNAKNRFYIPRRKRKLIYASSFILVDDVVTSGATASRCLTLLKQNGADKTICVCGARSVKYI